jgi:hypothetical protein
MGGAYSLQAPADVDTRTSGSVCCTTYVLHIIEVFGDADVAAVQTYEVKLTIALCIAGFCHFV